MSARMLLFLTVLACACGGGGGGGGGIGFAPGSACNPSSDKEICLGTLRMTCGADGKWAALTTCDAGWTCVAVPAASSGYATACAPGAGMDAFGNVDADFDALIGQPDLAGLDVALPDVTIDAAPDPADGSTAKDTGGPCGSAADCADNSPCTKDVCLPSGACSHTPDDSVCSDDDPCTSDLCLGDKGCTNPPTTGSCDDGNPCTVQDSCKSGACIGKPQNCDDGDPCTSDKCHPGGGCEYQELPGCKPDNSTIDGATPLDLGQATQESLAPTGTSRWFQFQGKKGQLVLAQTVTAQTKANKPFEPGLADTVLFLYGPDQQPYALNDDGGVNNDSEIWTVLPATGTWYVRVIECWTYLDEAAPPGGACADPKNKQDANFDVLVTVVDPPGGPNVVLDKELGNTADKATAITYAKASAGKYYASLLYGFFGGLFDIDVFQLTPPLDATVSQGRPSLTFEGFAGGKGGNGSTSGPGLAWVTTQAQPSKVLAKLDLSKGDLRVPAPFGQTYLLFVQHPPGSAGSHDFYVLQHYVGGSNPVEKDESGNDTLAGAETLPNSSSSGPKKFYVAGDLIAGAKDVDHFKLTPPSGKATFDVACSGGASGSGLQGLKVEVMTPAGLLLPGATAVESEGLVQLPNVQTSGSPVVVKVSAAAQDAAVAGAYYECGFLFDP